MPKHEPLTDAEVERLQISVGCGCGDQEPNGSTRHDNACEMVLLDRLLADRKRLKQELREVKGDSAAIHTSFERGGYEIERLQRELEKTLSTIDEVKEKTDEVASRANEQSKENERLRFDNKQQAATIDQLRSMLVMIRDIGTDEFVCPDSLSPQFQAVGQVRSMITNLLAETEPSEPE